MTAPIVSALILRRVSRAGTFRSPGPGILTYMPIEPSPAAGSGQDDFDRQLRDLTSGSAGEARFRELSAAERAKIAGRARPRMPRTLRNSFTARKLRKPVSGPPRKRTARRQADRRGLRAVGGRGYSSGPAAHRQRLMKAAKAAGILVGFVLLLVVLHFLGFGPQ